MKDYQIKNLCETIARSCPAWGTRVRVGEEVLVISANAALANRHKTPDPKPRADKGKEYRVDPLTGTRVIVH